MNTREIWKPIPGHAPYEASNRGRIRSNGAFYWERLGQPRMITKKHLLKPGISSNGLKTVCVSGEKAIHVHVLVALAWLGQKPAGHWVCHLNGRKRDNRPENLAYREERKARHIIAHEVVAKLTPEQVDEIRAAYAPRPTLRELGRRFGVTKEAVGALVRRRTWRCVQKRKRQLTFQA